MKKLYFSKQIKYKDFKNSPAMQDFLKKKGVAKALDKKSEKKEFYNRLKERSKDGVTQESLEETLGDFRRGWGKEVSKKEIQSVAKELTGGKYIFKPEEKKEVHRSHSFQASKQEESEQSEINSKINQKKPYNPSNLNNFSSIPLKRPVWKEDEDEKEDNDAGEARQKLLSRLHS